jgi:dihydropteroate synthase
MSISLPGDNLTLNGVPRNCRASSWKFGSRQFDLSARTHIMGVLNVTPDSFSDGSRFLDVEKAVDRALEMESEGADIIDVGGESTRPTASPVDETEELSRVLPVIDRLAGRLKIPLSVDTYKSGTAREALRAGAEIINDISGATFDSDMLNLISTCDAGLVLMHTRGRPHEMQRNTDYRSLVSEVLSFLGQRIETAESLGIRRERIIVDPGIGFAKNLDGNLEILRRLDEFCQLGCPVLIGTSRKSFIGMILGREIDGRIFGTAATVALAIASGASIIRVHDVREMRDVAVMTDAVMGRPARGAVNRLS